MSDGIRSESVAPDSVPLKFLDPILVKSLCLDHYSVIQNFFKKVILVRSDDVGNISHDRVLERNVRGMIVEKRSLEDFDDLNNVIGAFRRWQRHNALYPRVLHAHGYNGDRPLEATWEAQNRFTSNRNISPLSEALMNYQGKGVFLTLTVDPKLISLRDAWQSISGHWNRFLTRLSIEKRVKRKDMHYLWVLEAQGNGYPHIHALFLGIDYLYYAGNKAEWENDNVHSKNIKHFWHLGGMFVNRTKSGSEVRNPVSYMMKYIRKTFDPYFDDNKKELTQALLWAFNKRSWNKSRGLFEYLNYTPRDVNPMQLVEMDTFERLRGQATPFIRIVKKRERAPIEPLVVYTVDDIDYLKEKVGNMGASREEVRALSFLVKTRDRGLSYVYPMRPLLPVSEVQRIGFYKRFLRGSDG